MRTEITAIIEFACDNQQLAIDETMLQINSLGLTAEAVEVIDSKKIEKQNEDDFDDYLFTMKATVSGENMSADYIKTKLEDGPFECCTVQLVYRVPVYYNVCEYVCVKADSPEAARAYVERKQDKMSTHCGEAYYLDESYEIEDDIDMIHGYDETSREWDKGESYSSEFYDATEGAN